MISIIIPCFNEKIFLEKLLKKIDQVCKFQKEIILIDDGSDSQTKEIIKNCQNNNLLNEVITLDKNYGKGYALRKGIEKAKGEILVFQDSDLEYDPDDMKKLIEPILDNKADVVYGSRFISNDKGQRILYYWHRVANFILTTITNILTNINFSDMETGYKVFKASVIKDLDLKEDSFGIEPEITVKLARKR